MFSVKSELNAVKVERDILISSLQEKNERLLIVEENLIKLEKSFQLAGSEKEKSKNEEIFALNAENAKILNEVKELRLSLEKNRFLLTLFYFYRNVF